MPRAPLPPLLRPTPFLVREGVELGVSEKRLRGGDLCTPHSGLRLATGAFPAEHPCEIYLPLLRDDEVFSHATAAGIWGLPVPRVCADTIHLTRFGDQRPRRPGVVGHRANARLPATIVGGLPVVEPTLAWAQCSAELDLDDLVAMGDALAGRWSAHPAARGLTLDKLRAAVDDWGGRRGTRRLAEAMTLVRPHVWSPRETALRLLLVRAGLPEPPGLNAAITDATGRVLGHGDLAWPDERLVVEYEGDQHRTDRRQWRHDVAKYERYGDAGWRVVRVTDDDLGSPAILLSRVSRLLTERALQ